MSGIQLHIASVEEELPKPKKINQQEETEENFIGKKKNKKNKNKNKNIESNGSNNTTITTSKPVKKKEFPAKTFQHYIDSSIKSITEEDDIPTIEANKEIKKVEENKEKEEDDDEREEDQTFSIGNNQSTTFSKEFIDDLKLYKHLAEQLKSKYIFKNI